MREVSGCDGAEIGESRRRGGCGWVVVQGGVVVLGGGDDDALVDEALACRAATAPPKRHEARMNLWRVRAQVPIAAAVHHST